MRCRAALLAAALRASLLAASGCATHAKSPLPPPPPPRAPEALEAWRLPPALAADRERTLAWNVRRVGLANGLHVTVVHRPDSTTTAVKLWVPSASERGMGPVVVMGEALRAGTRTRAGDILVNPRLGQVPIRVVTSAKGTYLDWQVLPRASQQGVKLLADFVLHPVFDPAEVQIRVQQELASVLRFSGTHRHLAAIAREALPGFTKTEPDQDARRLLALKLAELQQAYRCTMRPERAELIVVGPVGSDVVLAWVEDSFGAWAARDSGADPACAGYEAEAGSEAAEEPPGIQARIVYGAKFDPYLVLVLRGPPPESDDYPAFALLSTVLEERDSGSSQQLRHTGATYGIHASIEDQLGEQTLLQLEGQIELGSFQGALRDLIRDIRTLARTVTSDELDRVRRRGETGYAYATSDNATIANSVLWELQRGHPPEDAMRWPSTLRNVDLAQCRKVAARWFSQANISFAVTGLPANRVGKVAPGIRVRELYWTRERIDPDKAAE